MATNNCNVCNEEMIEEVNDTLKQFERNKYFYGKLMTVKDFELEQGYFNGKRHLLNRLIHGVGIARGLKVTTPTLTGTTLKIALSSGVALDCWGREIVVDKEYSELNVTGTLGGDTKGYLYIKQKPCLKDPVPVLSNASTCEQECCYSRIKEDFEVIVSNIAPPVPDFLLDVGKYWKKDGEVYKDVNPVMGDIKSNEADWHEAEIIIAINEYLEKIGCPSCNDSKVLLAVIEKKADGSIVVNNTETHKYRSIVYNNPMLYDLISSHLVDFTNPHQVTAEQTGAIKSIDSVSNPGGNIDLVQDNAIVINSDDNNNKITIGETHSYRTDNPHGTNAWQVGALVSINGISNPGGNVELVAGANITITPASPDSITIASTAGVEPEQLKWLVMYVKERALKCTVINFKEVGKKFNNERALDLSKHSKEAIDKKGFEDEEKFIGVMKEIFGMQRTIANEIEEIATKRSWNDFSKSLEELKKALESKNSLKIATAQDEMCFYAMLLELRKLP